MGNRVIFQVVSNHSFSPAIYGHWAGGRVPEVCARLAKRMQNRMGDTDYTAARLVQELINGDDGCLSFGIWNAPTRLTETHSHGDAGVILVDVSGDNMKFIPLGGYYTQRELDKALRKEGHLNGPGEANLDLSILADEQGALKESVAAYAEQVADLIMELEESEGNTDSFKRQRDDLLQKIAERQARLDELDALAQQVRHWGQFGALLIHEDNMPESVDDWVRLEFRDQVYFQSPGVPA